MPARYDCFVPWMDGRPLINCIGYTEKEAWRNLSRYGFSDHELRLVRVIEAKIEIDCADMYGDQASSRVGDTEHWS